MWGCCAELVMPGEVVTLGWAECWESKTRTNHCSDGTSFGFECGMECCRGAQEMNVVSGDMGVDGVIVRFVLSTARLEWS